METRTAVITSTSRTQYKPRKTGISEILPGGRPFVLLYDGRKANIRFFVYNRPSTTRQMLDGAYYMGGNDVNRTVSVLLVTWKATAPKESLTLQLQLVTSSAKNQHIANFSSRRISNWPVRIPM